MQLRPSYYARQNCCYREMDFQEDVINFLAFWRCSCASYLLKIDLAFDSIDNDSEIDTLGQMAPCMAVMVLNSVSC